MSEEQPANVASGFQADLKIDRQRNTRVVFQYGNKVTCTILNEEYFLCSDAEFVATLITLGFEPITDQPKWSADNRAWWVFEGKMEVFERMAHDYFGAVREDEGITIASFRRAFSLRKAIRHILGKNRASHAVSNTLTLRRL